MHKLGVYEKSGSIFFVPSCVYYRDTVSCYFRTSLERSSLLTLLYKLSRDEEFMIAEILPKEDEPLYSLKASSSFVYTRSAAVCL